MLRCTATDGIIARAARCRRALARRPSQTVSIHHLYPLFRPLLFAADPETAHDVALKGLDAAARLGVARPGTPRLRARPVEVMGLSFPNHVGLAAGLDKTAAHLDGLATLGFGFIEVGTVTPRPQPGNPRPRLFRLPDAQALINRLGFNNGGTAALVANVARARYRGILGVNIGRNFDTPNERAADDYIACLRAVFAIASYVTINVSSPNTRGLRDLQAEDALAALLRDLTAERDRLTGTEGRRMPLALKLAPDLDDASLRAAAVLALRSGIDAIVATNTTIAREGVEGIRGASESGGLSGAPLRARALAAVRVVASAVDGALPIIGVGGIMTDRDAEERIAAGASLVQLYTGLIYRGPGLVADCVRATAR